MHYTLHQLNIFVEIAAHGSVTKAAERLHLTQPAVSIQLRKFQEQFEVPLVEIIGRKLHVTEFGREIEVYAKRILAEVDHIKWRTQSFKGELAGPLSFSVVSTAKYIMPYFISTFLHENRAVQLKMDVTNKQQVVSHLENNTVDFALVSVIPETLNVNQMSLMENKLCLIGRQDAPFTNDPPMDELPLIFREQGSATRNAMEKFLKSRQIPTTNYMSLTSNEAIKQAILAGLGYSIMPIIGLKDQLLNKELKIIPTKGLPVITMWNIIWLKEKKLSPIAEAYLEFLKNQKTSIIEKTFAWQHAIK